jgi:hypothetical protein
VPWTIIRENAETARQANTNATAVRQTELGIMGDAVGGSQSLAGQAIETYQPAEPIIVPAHAAPAAPTE